MPLTQHENRFKKQTKQKTYVDHTRRGTTNYCAPDCREGGIKRCFCPSVRPSVCPSVEYIANNSRTQRPSVPKFGRKVSHLRCDLHASFKVKRTNVRVRGGRGHTVSAEPAVTLLVQIIHDGQRHKWTVKEYDGWFNVVLLLSDASDVPVSSVNGTFTRA